MKMSMKQNAIKQYKDAMYLLYIYQLKIKAVPEGEENDYLRTRYATYMMQEDKAIDRLTELFTEKDKKSLLPKLEEECKNVAMTHFVIYNMAEESED